MDIEKIIAAEEEAERFLRAARAARDRFNVDRWAYQGCKETGAVKRASLDLTRALSAMRSVAR